MEDKLPKIKLEELYIKEKLTYKEISEIYNCSKAAIQDLMNKYDIKRYGTRERMIGEKINNFTIIDFLSPLYHNGKFKYLCECDCGQTTSLTYDALIKRKIDYCQKCRVYDTGNKSKTWKGYGEISGGYWSGIKQASLIRNHEFSISIEYAWELFLKQERKCKLTDIEISFAIKQNFNKEKTASLDRIDSSKGYVEGNVQWVHKDINIMKSVYNQDYFIEMCEKVIKHARK